MRPLSLVSAAALFGALACAPQADEAAPPAPTPAQVAQELFAADSTYGFLAGGMDLVTGISAMFADDVLLQHAGGMADGRAAAVEALRASPDAATARARWSPVRVGVSADGLHGFTYGYMTLEVGDTVRRPLKYLAYWVKGDSGWRVAAYKRRPRPAGEVSLAALPPVLPPALLSPSRESAVVAAFGETLRLAEQQFSDEAQQIGIGPAFAKHGHPNAMNMGGPNDTSFVLGNEAIGASIGRGSTEPTSPVSWGADRVLVASTGDLGVTFGVIRPNAAPPPGAPAGYPFFTIWWRATSMDPWKYIAE